MYKLIVQGKVSRKTSWLHTIPLNCDNDTAAIKAAAQQLTLLVTSSTWGYVKGITTTFRAVCDDRRVVCSITA